MLSFCVVLGIFAYNMMMIMDRGTMDDPAATALIRADVGFFDLAQVRIDAHYVPCWALLGLMFRSRLGSFFGSFFGSLFGSLGGRC